MRTHLLATALLLLTISAPAQLPPPPKDLAGFPFSYAEDAPGPISAAALLDAPAGRLGPVVARDGHFFTGNQRIRFWGVNLCFSANFPTHDQADKLAARLARFGINAVRFHHMDMFKFPRGIFADDALEQLSPEALDRLDYFIAVLKKHGVYADLNLHVSRSYARVQKFPNADKTREGLDKIIGLFHPDIIAADKKYARDLLTHVNKYTNIAYAAEPAVCMVEINNENTLFLWGGEQAIAALPAPYAGMLNARWNDWLVKKYASQDKLMAAWNVGAEPLGPNVVRDPGLASLYQVGSPYVIEQHEKAKMKLTRLPSDPIPLAKIDVTEVSGTNWHLQFSQPGLKLKKGQFYTLSFRSRTDGPKQITVAVSQAHAPYQNLGLAASPKLLAQDTDQYFGFTATADDDNARISFLVGGEKGTIYLGNLTLRTGGQVGVDKLNEDPAKGTVSAYQPGASWTAPRKADWYDFLQQTDEAYFVDMQNYLKKDLKLAAPITGTIGLGPLGTLSQSKMDYVDAHAYWDHPRFPRQGWNPTDWLIDNKPMVDHPAESPIWGLAATRVAGKPFTVTEYNHGAPNEWQAESVPMIATYAALQDWDAVYFFAYSHNERYEKTHADSYFDIEGNWLKMAAMPLGSRIFLGQQVSPSPTARLLSMDRRKILANASDSYYEIWKYTTREGIDWPTALTHRLANLIPPAPAAAAGPGDNRIHWSADKPGTGRFTLADDHAAVFTGFAPTAPIPLGAATLEKLDSPFASIVLTPADPTKTIAAADRLLLTAVARIANPGEKWNPQRTSVSNNWGTAPPQIETVRATLKLPNDYTVRPLDAAGKPVKEFQTTNKTLPLGDTPTLWYELIRR